MALPLPADKAVIYVYRHSATFSKGGRLAVFVNKDYLAFLPYSSYVVRQVPPGKVVVTATSRANGYPPPPFPWSLTIRNGHSTFFAPCSTLGWRNVGEEKAEVITECQNRLRRPPPELQRSAERALFVLSEVLGEQVGKYLRSRTALEVEPGKGYYISLSFGTSDVAEMKEVDTMIGAKEIRGLRLAVK
ncbi:MAG: hypothetical protein WB992_07265 [Bryobacteraceae bacterium]